jgi:hypothetical protein
VEEVSGVRENEKDLLSSFCSGTESNIGNGSCIWRSNLTRA